MTTTEKDPVLVVIQLTGGNDYLNTIVPYADPLYQDNRPKVGVPVGQVLPIDDHYGFNPALASLKNIYDEGHVAVINGIGYPNPNRSHFRAMDIWHTCEPDRIATEGWLGRVIRDLDPASENVLTGVNFGRGLPRALALPGVPVASVAVLENHGVLTAILDEEQRTKALGIFARMYAPAIGAGPAMDYLGRTGTDALKGADVLKSASESYSSSVEYAATPIAQNLRGIAKVLLAGLGTRVFYTIQAGYDTHSGQIPVQTQLLTELSEGIADFYADLNEHQASGEVLILVFTEFGRRVRDNGSGTDHGSGGAAFVIGDRVTGGMHGVYPSLRETDLLDGDLHFQVDFRSVYSTIAVKWLELDAKPIVGGNYEQLDFL
jgi:uncharacterized protein (DUF1501 family)